MFDIRLAENGDVLLSGRFDASQEEKAKEFFSRIDKTTSVDFHKVTYISSAGLGILLSTQKRLNERGEGLRLKNISGHIRDIFRIARFELVFEIE